MHPCPHYIEQSCSIYAIRPWRCGDYQCQVLKKFLESEIDADAAHALVDRAKSLREALSSSLPDGLTATKLAQEVKAGKGDDRSPARLLALARFVTYRMFVERHFLTSKGRWMMRDKA